MAPVSTSSTSCGASHHHASTALEQLLPYTRPSTATTDPKVEQAENKDTLDAVLAHHNAYRPYGPCERSYLGGVEATKLLNIQLLEGLGNSTGTANGYFLGGTED